MQSATFDIKPVSPLLLGLFYDNRVRESVDPTLSGSWLVDWTIGHAFAYLLSLAGILSASKDIHDICMRSELLY